MNANELMIGDWVKIQEPDKYAGAIGQVNSLTSLEGGYFAINIQDPQFGYLVTEVFCDDIAPIPLTAGMLEKNGFKKSTKISYYKNVLGTWRSSKYDTTIKQYFLTREKSVFVVNGGFSKIGNINHVHELQHAMRLAGINKEFTI